MADHRTRPSGDDTEEPAGAVREAAALLLAGQGGAAPDPVELRAAASRGDLWQGSGTLMFALLRIIPGAEGDPLDLVAPVLRRLRRIEPELPDDVVATIGGALIAAALGHSPTRWRTDGGPGAETRADDLPVPTQEAYGWLVCGRLLVDLLDHVAGPGSAAALLGEL